MIARHWRKPSTTSKAMSNIYEVKLLTYAVECDPFPNIVVFEQSGEKMCYLPYDDDIEEAIYEWLVANGHNEKDYRLMPLMHCPKCGEQKAIPTGKDYLIEFDEQFDDESIVEHECGPCKFVFYIPAIN